MHICRLQTRGLRNLQGIDLRLGRQLVVLEGRNGQGKTNFLEALYICATGRSFRMAPVAEMIAHGQRRAQVEATFERQGVRHDIAVSLAGRSRSIAIDGRRGRHAPHLFALVNVVAFFPDDLRIVKEGPERRRHFLDRAVANSQPAFVVATLAYHRALRARNALLRQPTPPDRVLVAAYNDQLVEHGQALQAARHAFIGRWQAACQEHFRRLMPEAVAAGQDLQLALDSGVPGWQEPAAAGRRHEPEPAGTSGFAAAFGQALAAGYPRDRARGFSTIGPHRADLSLSMGGYPARQFASQGQQRAIVLCLKLAEVTALHAQLGTAPVVLLDDISSELDQERTAALFGLVTDIAGQAFVTSTSADALPLPRDSLRLRLEGGRLIA